MRPKTGTLTPGSTSSRQKGAGAERVPLGVRERGRKRGDSGSAPDVPRESGPGDPECPGVGVGGVLDRMIVLITASELGERVAEVIRSIVTMLFEVTLPILTAVGAGQILVGLLLALGLRQEWLGWRLIVAGLLTLVFVYIIVPFLLSFI